MTTMLAFGKQQALRICGWMAVCAMAAAAATAQSVSPRITQQVDDSSRVALQGNISMALRSATDLGAVDTSTSFEHVRLTLQRSSEQKAALQQYLAQLQQKSSANYHKWLTPAEFGARFGLADSDLSAIVAWLESQGFSDISVSKGRTDIDFSGTAGQMQQAFQTTIHSFTRSNRQFYANISNPTIPSALSGVVSGVTHLSTLGPRPFLHQGIPGRIDPDTKRLTSLNVSSDSITGLLRSNMTLEDSSSNYYLYLVPGDAATIYNTPNSFNANFSASTSYTGSGVTIGIIGDATISTTPVTNYRTKFLGESSPTAPTVSGTATSTSDADEAYLDLEISGGLAPGAIIHFYTGSDDSLATQISTALNANQIDILSVSFGECEQDMTTSDNALYYGYWEQAAAQGIPVTVSAGDSGSAGCDATSDSSGNTTTTATGGLAVSGLASTPYNIAVGGTDFQLTQSNYTTYASTTDSSSTYYRTAKSWIPEKVWNDSTQTNTTISANYPWTTTNSTTSINENIVAGSGGKSSCSTNSGTGTTSGCTSGYSKPSWQRGTGVPSDSVRDLPDVSLMSGVDYYSAWLVCTNSTYGSYTLDCGSSTGGYYDGYGGTSAAAPAFAGILALVQQSQGGGRLGQAAANLYNLYNNSSSASSIFHDITVGNNSVPCTSGSTNCSKNTAGYYFLTGYDTNTGYDLASGLGSVNATELVSNWSSSMGSATATVAATPASTTIDVGNALAVAVTVSGSSGTPTGSVSLTGGGYTSSAADLDSGSATITIPANSLATGADTLTITYSGDGTYSSNTTTAAITVNSTALTATTTTLTSSSTAPTYGTSITLTATVSSTAATGTAIFYDGTAQLGSGTVSAGVATLSTAVLTVGTHALTASYSGDSTYAGSTSSSLSVTVSSSSSGGSSGSGGSGTSTVTVTPSGGYTGTVEFGLTTSSAYIVDYACYTLSNASVTGTSAVSQTLTIYLGTANCSTTAIQKGTVHAFTAGGTRKIASAASGSNRTLAAGLSLAGLLAAGLVGWRFRRTRVYLSLLVLALMGFSLSACGGGSSGSSSTSKSFAVSLSPTTMTVSAGDSSVPTGTYSLEITGEDSSSSSLTSSAYLTLTVD